MTNRFDLFHGNALDELKKLEAGSIHSCVTDPPYELGFMGRKWDSSGIAYNVDLWREVYRVLKPGAHLAAFGGTRTYHRMAIAIEDAGFEIRDQLAWVYGSGFPKSMDVSKAIDRQKGNREEILRVTAFIREARDKSGVTNRQIDDAFGTNGMAGHWTSSTSQPEVPTAEHWPRLLALLGVDIVPLELRDIIEKLIREKGMPGPNWFKREVTGQHKDGAPAQTWNENFGNRSDTTPKERRDKAATPQAAAWEGWGTALKPAWEPIVLARKPLGGTIADNVVKHATGALNIDGSRVPFVSTEDQAEATEKNLHADFDSGPRKNRIYGADSRPMGNYDGDKGRWPGNILWDGSHEVEALFPDDGELTSARFFYSAKASTEDREAGLEEARIALRTAGELTHRKDGSDGLKSPRAGAGGQSAEGRRNHHPTVKPTALMAWLAKLITPPQGTVLDPFMGSGSTGRAAAICGFSFVGIDLTEEYIPIARARINEAIGPLFLATRTPE